MAFRAWYHCCQCAPLCMALVAIGWVLPARWLTTIGMSLVVPLGMVGAMLGLLVVTYGIRTACPLCGHPAYWDHPTKNVVAVDCEQCGLVGGTPWGDFRPRALDELYVEEDDGRGATG